MELHGITDQDREDLLQALYASIHRLKGKIVNDIKNGREDFDRVKIRIDKIERARILIGKMAKNGE